MGEAFSLYSSHQTLADSTTDLASGTMREKSRLYTFFLFNRFPNPLIPKIYDLHFNMILYRTIESCLLYDTLSNGDVLMRLPYAMPTDNLQIPDEERPLILGGNVKRLVRIPS